MKAIILAAGKGTRLGEIGKSGPKCLIRIGNKAIIEHQVGALKSNGISDISVVIGYYADRVREALKNAGVKFYLNKYYGKTGMLESLFCARDELNDEAIILYGDVIFKPDLIKNLLKEKNDFCLVVDGKKEVKGDTKVKIIGSLVKDISKNLSPEESSGKYIGIAKFSKKAISTIYNRIKALIDNGGIKEYPSPSYLIMWLIEKGNKIHVAYIDNLLYEEIDDSEDLERAKVKFAEL